MQLKCGDCGYFLDAFGDCDCTTKKPELRKCAACGEHIPPLSAHYIILDEVYCTNCVRFVDYQEDEYTEPSKVLNYIERQAYARGQEEIMNWLYPNRPSPEEREQLRKEHLKNKRKEVKKA